MTLVETICEKLNVALNDDAQLDAAAEAANMERQKVIDALSTVMTAIEQVPEDVLIAAVQEHLTKVNVTVQESAISEPAPEVVAYVEAMIDQVRGDAEEMTPSVEEEIPAEEGSEEDPI